MFNREQRRRLSHKEVNDIMEEAKNDVASSFLLCAINVCGKRGWSEEELQQLAVDIVEEYNSITDYKTYKQKTYDTYGISIERGPDG